jgi:hypothetical protein
MDVDSLGGIRLCAVCEQDADFAGIDSARSFFVAETVLDAEEERLAGQS